MTADLSKALCILFFKIILANVEAKRHFVQFSITYILLQDPPQHNNFSLFSMSRYLPPSLAGNLNRRNGARIPLNELSFYIIDIR